MAAQINLFNLIFQEILKISPNLLYQYPSIQDQVIHLLFLPHVILFLFIWGFGMMLMPPTKDNPNAHKGFRYLISIAAYIFIVYQGWYGSFLIPLLQTWFYIMLIFGLFLFFVTKIYHPTTAKKFGGVGTAIGQTVGERMARRKKKDTLEEELSFIKKRIRYLKGRPHDRAVTYEIESYERQKKEKEREIKKLGG